MTLSDDPPPAAPGRTEKALLDELERAHRRIAALERAAEKESEVRTSAILDNVADGIVTIDERGRIESFNPAAVAMFGYTAEEAIGRNVSMLMPEPYHGAHDGYLGRYLETGESEILGVGPRELTGLRKDGGQFPVELAIGKMWLDGEQRFIGTLRDITRRKKTERALGESEAIVRLIADSLPVPISSFDTEQRYRFVNQCWTRWNRQSAAEAIGKRVEDVLGARRYRAVRAQVERALAGEPQAIADRVSYPDGQTRDIEAMLVPDKGPEGRVTGVFVLIRDVSNHKRAEAALRESEERFSDFAEAASDWFWEMGPDLRFDFGSDRFFQLTGWKPEEVYGKDRAVFHQPDLEDLASEKWRDHFALMQRHEPFQNFEYTTRTKDGAPFHMSINGKPIFAADEAFGGYRGTGTNITKRKQAEEAEAALREQEITFNALMDSVTDELFVKDTDGRYQSVNAEAAALFAQPAEEIIGRTEAELFPQINTDLVNETDRRVLDFGETQTFELEMKFGEITRWIMVRKGPLRTADGRIRGLVGVGRDITDIKRAAEALRQSEERVRLIADALPVFISYFDTDNCYQFVNESYASLYERRAVELIGQRVEAIVGSARYEQIRPDMERALAGGDRSAEYKLSYPDGTTRDMEFTYIPHLGAGGGVLGVYVMGTDVTERKRAEEQLRQAQKMEAVGQLTGGIAHDFNNLLAVILGNADLAMEELREGDSLKGYLDALTRAAIRGAELTSQLLAFSRKQTLRPRSIEIDALADGMLDFLRRTLGETIEIQTKHEPGLLHVEADPGQLENVILNLAINARDAMPGGGVLAIAASNIEIGEDFAVTDPDIEAGPYVALTVRDTGEGMPEEVVEHIFEPFYTTKGVGQGSGLGLSMVYGFIRQSGGHVEVESEVGQGTTVKLYLPAVRKAKSDAKAPGREKDRPHGGETILVVEDDDEVRMLAIDVLEGLGYAAIGVADGEAALAALREYPDVALLFSDVVLPGGMNGPEVAVEARRMRPDLKVLFLSGYIEIAGIRAGQVPGDDELVRKPFRVSDVAEKVRAALDR